MTAVQEASARVGAVTGKGLAAVMRDRYGVKLVYGMVVLLLLANTINIGADLGAMTAALGPGIGGRATANRRRIERFVGSIAQFLQGSSELKASGMAPG